MNCHYYCALPARDSIDVSFFLFFRLKSMLMSHKEEQRSLEVDAETIVNLNC